MHETRPCSPTQKINSFDKIPTAFNCQPLCFDQRDAHACWKSTLLDYLAVKHREAALSMLNLYTIAARYCSTGPSRLVELQSRRHIRAPSRLKSCLACLSLFSFTATFGLVSVLLACLLLLHQFVTLSFRLSFISTLTHFSLQCTTIISNKCCSCSLQCVSRA